VVLNVPGYFLMSFINFGCTALKQHLEVLRVDIEVIVSDLDHFLLLLVLSLELTELSSETFNAFSHALLLLFSELETMIFLSAEL